MTQHELDIEHGAPDPERMKKYEVDRTPFPVALQCTKAVHSIWGGFSGIHPRTVLDPSAGDGVWCAAARTVWPDAEVYGVEPRSEDTTPGHRWPGENDHIYQCTFEEWAGLNIRTCANLFDVIITNPPFSLWAQWFDSLIHHLHPQGLLALYGLSLWGHSDEPSEGGSTDPAVRSVFERHPPIAQLRIHGRVRHRFGKNPKNGKKYSTDSRKYSLWVWREEPTLDTWMCRNLAPLTTEERTLRPGQMDEVWRGLA